MTGTEYEYKFKPTKDTPYLALTGELWGVFCDVLGEDRLHYNGTTLYFAMQMPLISLFSMKHIMSQKHSLMSSHDHVS